MTQPRRIVSFILFAMTVLILSVPNGAQSIKAARTPGKPAMGEQVPKEGSHGLHAQ